MSNINQHLEEISQIIQKIKNAETLLDYETIELPFDLAQEVTRIWKSVFTPEVLQQLAKDDIETLDLWGISFSQFLQNQLKLLEFWNKHLDSLPIPDALKEKIAISLEKLNKISQEKLQFLQKNAILISQENQLKQESIELKQLQNKVIELNKIKAEIESINLEELKQEVATESALIETQQQKLESLKQEKAKVEETFSKLEEEESKLTEAVNNLTSRNSQLEIDIQQKKLEIKNKQEQVKIKEQSLSNIQSELESQQAEYNEVKEQLEKAIEDLNKHQTTTEKIRNHLKINYQVDQDLAEILHVNQVKIKSIIKNIQDNLSQLDQELANAQKLNDKSKSIIQF